MQWFRINAMNVVGCLIWCNFDHYWWRYIRNIWQFESVAHNEPKQWPRVNVNNPVGSSLVLTFSIDIAAHLSTDSVTASVAADSIISIYITMLKYWNGDSASTKWHLHYYITICIAVLNELLSNSGKRYRVIEFSQFFFVFLSNFCHDKASGVRIYWQCSSLWLHYKQVRFSVN